MKQNASRFGGVWFMDEVFINIRGERYYLWRAVGQDGDVIDILEQKKRDGKAAKRFLSIYFSVYNVFNLQRHLCSAEFYKIRRSEAFAN